MELKNMKKVFTAVVSASMLIGSVMPAMAADGNSVDVTAPIYSFDVVNVVVPTTYAVAFNPEGLTVKKGSTTSTDQILSKNFGIVNKSSKDKVITATLTVEDQNTGSGITFVDSADDVDNAEDGEYKIHLTAIPADATEVKIGNASADKDTAAAALGDVEMTAAAAGKEVTLKAGANQIGFKLEKATYSPKASGGVELGTSVQNNVQNSFELTALAGSGKGITAFTFGGEMNANADWFKLQNGIKISVVYGNETAPSDTAVIDGTGAMVALTAAPAFATGDAVGEIKYTAGAGGDSLDSITKIEMTNSYGAFDGFNAEGAGLWPAATDVSGVITLSSEYLGYYISEMPDASTLEATVTYVTAGGETKTATVDVKLK